MNWTWIDTLLRRPPIGWWDLADILVVSVIVYEILKLIRGTRTVQMALGGGVLAVLFYGSRWGHLETVNWLIRNLVGYIVFAVIVLFQSDIRRALAHFGRAPFFRYFAKVESAEESIEELAMAASLLSSQRVGAIVAIERQIGLRNYIEGGIPLDAVLTYDLLVSIFQLKSPLHDGAVIVQEDRVAAAACFLPLTVNPKLSKELGSRHRAAIGLTEENDAIAIVISEETGSISVVVDGQIERGLSSDELRARLRSLILHKVQRKSRREVQVLVKAPWPFGHFGLKVLSVAFAALLWFAVSGEETVERGLRAPLELQQFPGGLELLGEAPSLVDVRVRGASGTLSRVGPGDIVAVLDLKTARVGRRLYQMTAEQVRAPFGVQVIQVTPPTIPLSFESSVAKLVPVVPAVEGDPAPGYVVGKVTVDPSTVEVVGPQSSIARVTEAVTEPVSVSGARAVVNDGVTVGFLDPLLRLKSPRLARVSVEVLPGPVERTLRDRPVHLRNIGAGLLARSTPNVVEVVLRGSREGVNRAEPDDVGAFVDLAGLGAGDYTLAVRADGPPRAGVARVLPATVQVTISSGKD